MTRSAPLFHGPIVATICLAFVASCTDTESTGNRAPIIALDPDVTELTVTVGDVVTVGVLARDDDNDPLTFRYETQSDNELSTLDDEGAVSWFPSADRATFRWTPDSGDITRDAPVELIFAVEDGRGGYADRKLSVSVAPGNGKPQFESSANELYNNCCDRPISFEVKVRDDDDASVTLRMTEAPEGANFDVVDGKRGQFSWKPSGDEASQRVHNAVFVADDKKNPPATHRVTIIIPSDDADNDIDLAGGNDTSLCRGEEAISHTPLGTQRSASPSYPIKATLSPSAIASFETFRLYWSEADLVKNKSATVLSVPLEVDGTTLRGELTNVTLDDGKPATIYYQICGLNETTGELLCNPTSRELYHSFNAYPNEQEGCKDDGLEDLNPNDSIEQAQPVGRSGWNDFSLCADNPDYHSVTIRPGAKVAVLISHPKTSAPMIEVIDADGAPVSGIDVTKSSCVGLSRFELSVDASAQAQTYYVRLTGDEIPYHIKLSELESSNNMCQDAAYEPNDGVEGAVPIGAGESLTKLEICPSGDDIDMYAIDLQAGQKLDLSMNFTSASQNLLDMTLFAPTQVSEISPTSTGVAFTFDFQSQKEQLTYESRYCGTHYLMVFSPDGEATASYGLSSQVSAGSCMDTDEFGVRCNHDPANAPPFAWNREYTDLMLCPKGEDWLRHSGLSSSILGELMTQDPGDISEMTLEIQDEDGKVLTTGTKNGDRIDIDYAFKDERQYFFRIKSSADKVVNYSLHVISE